MSTRHCVRGVRGHHGGDPVQPQGRTPPPPDPQVCGPRRERGDSSRVKVKQRFPSDGSGRASKVNTAAFCGRARHLSPRSLPRNKLPAAAAASAGMRSDVLLVYTSAAGSPGGGRQDALRDVRHEHGGQTVTHLPPPPPSLHPFARLSHVICGFMARVSSQRRSVCEDMPPAAPQISLSPSQQRRRPRAPVLRAAGRQQQPPV